MIENKNNENKLTNADYLRLVLILSVSALILMFLWIQMTKKYADYKGVQSFNDTYNYAIINNQIRFLSSTNENINIYTCSVECSVVSEKKMKYLYEDSSYVIIKEGEKFILYNISSNKSLGTFGSIPTKFTNSEFGMFKTDDKIGFVNNKGKTIIEAKYDSITKINGYYVSINSNMIDVYDEKGNIVNDSSFEITKGSEIKSKYISDGVLVISADKEYQFKLIKE